MGTRLSRIIFWALVGAFVVLIGIIFFLPVLISQEVAEGDLPGFIFILRISLLALSSIALLVLGITLLVLTKKGETKGAFRKFQLLTGASAVGIPVSILLHNAIYGLFIYFFGANFWTGGDEPFFFIVAIIVCPLGFLVGAVGSIVLAIKNYRMAKKSASSLQ